jgi:CBS domain-containing protein
MLRINEIMTRDVATVSPETTLREAMELLAREHVSGAPVVSGHAVLGVVTDADLLAFAASLRGVPTQREDGEEWSEWNERDALDTISDDSLPDGAFFSEMWDDAGADTGARFDSEQSPEWNTLEEHVVSEVMTRALWTLPSSASAREAAELMREHVIHRVLVVDEGVLVGIVSSLDIAKAAADDRFTKRTYVFNRD